MQKVNVVLVQFRRGVNKAMANMVLFKSAVVPLLGTDFKNYHLRFHSLQSCV